MSKSVRKAVPAGEDPFEKWLQEKSAAVAPVQKNGKAAATTTIEQPDPFEEYFKKKSDSGGGVAPSSNGVPAAAGPAPAGTPAGSPSGSPLQSPGAPPVQQPQTPVQEPQTPTDEVLNPDWPKRQPSPPSDFLNPNYRPKYLFDTAPPGAKSKRPEPEDIFSYKPPKPKPKPKVNIGGIDVDIEPEHLPAAFPYTNNPDEATARMQQRINNKAYTPADINAVSRSLDVPAVAGKALLDGKPNTFQVIAKDDLTAKKNTAIAANINQINRDLGFNVKFEDVMASPEAQAAYLEKVKNGYEQKNDKIRRAEFDEQLKYRSAIPGAIGVGGLDGGFNLDETNEETTSNITAYTDLKKLLDPSSYEKIALNRASTREAAIQKQWQLAYKENREAVLNAQADRTRGKIFGRMNPLANLFRTEKGEQEQMDMLNATKGELETGITGIYQDRISYLEAKMGMMLEDNPTGKLNEQDYRNYQDYKAEIEGLQKKIVSRQELEKKYPTLKQRRLADDVNEYYTAHSSTAKDADDPKYQRIKTMGFAEYLREKGHNLDDAGTKDFLSGVNFKEFDPIQTGVLETLNVFGSALKSVGDWTGFRDDMDRQVEMIRDERYPSRPDDKELKPWARWAHNVASTTGQVIGQGVLQAATGGLGKLAGLNAARATTLGFYTSGIGTSYDQALKEASKFTKSDAGQVAYASLIGWANAVSEKIFPESKFFDIPGVKDVFAQIASKVGTHELTEELVRELLGTARDHVIAYMKKFPKALAKNVGQETAEELAVQVFEDGLKALWGDPETTKDKAIENALNTAYQTATGMAVIGLWGAHHDIMRENPSSKSLIYKAGLWHDQATDAINLGHQQGLYGMDERNQKIKTVNTATTVIAATEGTEKVTGKKLSQKEKEIYVANLTAESLLREQADATKDEVAKKQIAGKIANLQKQREQILNREVSIDKEGNVFSLRGAGAGDPNIRKEFEYDRYEKNLESQYEWQREQAKDFLKDPKEFFESTIAAAERRLETHPDDEAAKRVLADHSKKLDRSNELHPVTVSGAVIDINGKTYEGKNHAEAILKAKEAGEDISGVDRKAEGKFKLSDGTVIDRAEAKKRFGQDRSEMLIDQDEAAKTANKEYEKLTAKPVLTPQQQDLVDLSDQHTDLANEYRAKADELIKTGLRGDELTNHPDIVAIREKMDAIEQQFKPKPAQKGETEKQPSADFVAQKKKIQEAWDADLAGAKTDKERKDIDDYYSAQIASLAAPAEEEKQQPAQKTEAVTKSDIHQLAQAKGQDYNSEDFKNKSEKLTGKPGKPGKRHLDEMDAEQLQEVKNYLSSLPEPKKEEAPEEKKPEGIKAGDEFTTPEGDITVLEVTDKGIRFENNKGAKGLVTQEKFDQFIAEGKVKPRVKLVPPKNVQEQEKPGEKKEEKKSSPARPEGMPTRKKQPTTKTIDNIFESIPIERIDKLKKNLTSAEMESFLKDLENKGIIKIKC